MRNREFNQAVWEIRKKYGRQFLTKRQFIEAFMLYKAAEKNKERFENLLKEMFIMKGERNV